MTTGLTRRQGAQDSLAGRQDMQPVTLQGPGLNQPRPMRAPDMSAQARIAQQLGQWSGGKLAEAVNKQQQKDMLDGQMAYQQGKTLEEADMGGNKWALEGFMLMDAQTISSSLLAAEREQIAQIGHTLTPEQYRAQYTNRLDAMLEGKDQRTANLVREQMVAHMPTLVADHTTQHLQFREGQNFESLERSIDVISRDPTATDQLVDFARGGDDSPSAGLSDARRQAATVSGVVRAFDNDNPLAYSALAREGLLGDNLTTAEQNAIKAAQKRFEQRRRTEYNEELFNGEQALMRRVETGEIDPSKAVEELSVLYADHDINMTAAEAGAIYDQSLATSRTARLTRGALIEEAGLRGDLHTQADIIMDSLIVTESSGQVDAFRTNKDGRTMGGLVQMSQARLDDYANATGGPRITPRQYANMSAGEQRAIARWHFIDLIRAAQETGAINSKINGVTVTLSGLVAVGHLGGKGGMRNFVRTNGAYNPSDELGTSLTDYLSRHGSGEMEEHMPADQRYRRATQRLQETRERLALDTYEVVAPKMAELDDQFRRGELDNVQWKEARQGLYRQYDVERTKADVNHEINLARQVDASVAAAAKQTTDDAYKLALEAANAQLVAPRLAWEEVINDPASTPEAIRNANQIYLDTRAQVFGEYGIAALDQQRGAVAEEVITSTKEATDRHVQFQEEQVEIDHATANGYLGSLPKNLQQRAFDQNEKEIIETYTNEVAEGRMTEDQANAAISQEFNNFYAEAGVVDPKVAMRMTAAVMGPMIDDQGNPNPEMVDAIQQYAEVKAANPRAADSMLDPEAMVRAEAVLSRSSDPSLVGEAVRNIGLEDKNSPLIEDTREYMARPDVQERIDREVQNYLDTRDIGLLHAIWQGDATLDQWWGDNSAQAVERMRSDGTREQVRGELAEEVARLQRITPGIKPRDLVARAAENLSARTEIIGGDVVMLAPGQDFGTAFFGDRATEFMHDGAVNSAVMEYLGSNEVLEQYPWIDDTSVWEHLPSLIQGGIGAMVDILPGDMAFDPAISGADARSTARSGVRPFRAFPAPGGGVVVEVLMPNGNFSDAIVIDPRRAGEMYMTKRRREMTQ